MLHHLLQHLRHIQTICTWNQRRPFSTLQMIWKHMKVVEVNYKTEIIEIYTTSTLNLENM